MTPVEFYTRRAEEFLAAGRRIPIDLFYQLLAVGVDIDALERNHRSPQ